MIRTLVLNGSPRGEQSNTLKLAEAFCEGLRDAGTHEVEYITLRDEKIGHCTGCFGCWTRTPGRCVIKDDMEQLMEEYIRADLVIWSFPLYYFGMPSKTKAFLDRLLPLNKPQIIRLEDGGSSHPPRYDLSGQKQVLISTCGFFSRKNNYEALLKQFDILHQREGAAERPCRILCPEGELFSQPPLKAHTDSYLRTVRKAGAEFARQGSITAETETALQELLYPPEAFMEMANASWEIAEETPADPAEKQNREAERFIRQMAAAYNPGSCKTDTVLELAFTDIGQTFQLLLGQERCVLNTGTPVSPTTRIETAYTTWREISGGSLNGAEAMMKGLMKVSGEFDTMNRMGDYFGTGAEEEPEPPGEQPGRSNMSLTLIPWIALWILLPMDFTAAGGIAAIGLCSLIPLAGLHYKLTPYDRATAFLVSLLGLGSLLELPPSLLASFSYLCFGALWMVSTLLKIPLTAYYSSRNFGGPKAYGNPLFMKTNRILTACWGIAYLLLGPASWLLLHSPLKSCTGIVLQALPLVLGVFTRWFQKWYPAKVAG